MVIQLGNSTWGRMRIIDFFVIYTADGFACQLQLVIISKSPRADGVIAWGKYRLAGTLALQFGSWPKAAQYVLDKGFALFFLEGETTASRAGG